MWKVLARYETLIWGGFAIVLIGLFARTMNEELRHDEQMFVAAGALFSDLKLYTEFNYGHLPNLPMLLGGVYQLAGTEFYLLVGRVIVFVAWAATLGATYLLTLRLTSERLIAVVATLLLATNSVLVSHVGVTTSNNFTPIVFPILAFYLFFAGLEGREPKPLYVFAAGLCLSVAAGLKVSYIVAIPPFAMFAFFLPSHAVFSTRLLKVVLPLALGGVVGAIPTFYYLAAAPDAFLFNTLEFHLGPQRVYWSAPERMAEVTGLTLATRVFYAFRLWFFGSTVLILIAAGYFFLALAGTRGSQALSIALKSWTVILSGALLVLAVMMALFVKPSFPQYYMPPVPFAVIFAVCLYRLLDHNMRKAAQPVVLTLAIATAVMGGPYLFQDLPKLSHPSNWTGVRVHGVGKQIARAMREAGAPGTFLATHNPIYALEGGLDVYPELATGSFFFRIGDEVSPEQRQRFRVGSASTLVEMLDANPPAGILVGFEGDLDAPLIAYARERGYRKLPATFGKDRYGEGTLYVRSAS